MFDEVLERFVAACPVAVLARLVVQRALSAAWVDGVFAAHAEQQYTRELLFSTVVDLMTLVTLGLRPSLHAAAQEALASGTLRVTEQALYAKVNHTEPGVLRALVRESATRLVPVLRALRPTGITGTPWLAGYRVRVLDGNHLPATEKRVKALRGLRAAAMPGQTLVLYDPEHDLVLDLVPGEDALASEPTLAPPLLATAGPGELWIADRNFATRALVAALHERGAAVLVREHATRLAPTPVGPRVYVGASATGGLYEQPVDCPPPEADRHGPVIRLRRIEVELDAPLGSGERVLRLLTTLPANAATAEQVAALYRQRWTIEGLFQRLEAVLHSEGRTLGQPRAALLAFGVAVVAYNVLAVVQAAIATTPEASRVPNASASAISLYYVAHTIREHYRGMLVAVPPGAWARYDALRPAQLARLLRRIARAVQRAALRKHARAPTPKRPTGYAALKTVQRQVATARLLRQPKPPP